MYLVQYDCNNMHSQQVSMLLKHVHFAAGMMTSSGLVAPASVIVDSRLSAALQQAATDSSLFPLPIP